MSNFRANKSFFGGLFVCLATSPKVRCLMRPRLLRTNIQRF